MANLTEIRWHGRGGQGSKTASILLGKVASKTGKNIQAFPEYGPERMGAPVLAFNRISDEKLTVHCQVYSPDIVMVLDPTLLESVDVDEGVPADGTIIINTTLQPSEIKEKLGFDGKVFTVDANGISTEEIGAPFPNTPMLGALIKATGLLEFEGFKTEIKKEFEKKFASKPEVIDGNMKSIERAYQEVKSE
ncbi:MULTISPECIES: 2-oxoacid:acceptor oxidoreductase family protein [unclassified Candidatus Frackibacter]|uniref:2-oxoacid:acceptor oxidoreductase family protein n=1 Tax=unclassified Candidatus Frackibacter TaxID=2648818 RepID=UPI0007919B39|nr:MULTISPECIES: 2-oxoacid:acceptor oxidoreductase family protein [unclassified Candidatus Frackibacter]KXS45817.1 MAG: pyruvate ferredoxin oxidoreductase, gamma subunit [Candidatus Frackibacter sp. T328-2]SDC54120.1 pyruvate ferredoxin oxidoreductase, gamma subunit [Candidatus Frackibacter sp. WG11]SEM66348.1 pyruvate ferredoxin oxidoreductase, gamma subunit [Candidatus Frackibacter sp. WG12]SFL77719.1 pyruvate ferredoxin oxidoreductase, gamma subunit [Candidatus Frackibacter sp. WG13]